MNRLWRCHVTLVDNKTGEVLVHHEFDCKSYFEALKRVENTLKHKDHWLDLLALSIVGVVKK